MSFWRDFWEGEAMVLLMSIERIFVAGKQLNIIFSMKTLFTLRLVILICKRNWFYIKYYSFYQILTFFKLMDFLTSKGKLASNLYFLLNLRVTTFLPTSMSKCELVMLLKSKSYQADQNLINCSVKSFEVYSISIIILLLKE